MKVGIDATNIKAGGGLTHLKSVVESLRLNDAQLILLGGQWLEVIEQVDGVKVEIFENSFSSFLKQEFFKKMKLPKLLGKTDIAFIPGGTFSSKKIKYVSMSQNMLVFEDKERNRFPKSFNWLRYHLLEKNQVRSFRNAAGIIYISNYAKKYIEKKYPDLSKKKSCVVYHGISNDFRQKPKKQKQIEFYTKSNPFIITYISIINFYKHQWNVIEAVDRLFKEGYPIKLKLIGPMYKPAKKRFDKAITGKEGIVEYIGSIPYYEISDSYKNSDLFVFASTCENMPNILVEAMSAGLPILSSSYGPMPEVLKDGGIYMDPTDVKSIYDNLKKLILDEDLRADIAGKAYNYSQSFSWQKTADETFKFLQDIYNDNYSK